MSDHFKEQEPVKEEEYDPQLTLVDLMNQFNNELDQLCQDRHFEGQKKYGDFTFLENDMFKMIEEEFADAMNYMRYQYVKFKLLQLIVMGDPAVAALANSDGEVHIGVDSFKSPGQG